MSCAKRQRGICYDSTGGGVQLQVDLVKFLGVVWIDEFMVMKAGRTSMCSWDSDGDGIGDWDLEWVRAVQGGSGTVRAMEKRYETMANSDSSKLLAITESALAGSSFRMMKHYTENRERFDVSLSWYWDSADSMLPCDVPRDIPRLSTSVSGTRDQKDLGARRQFLHFGCSYAWNYHGHHGGAPAGAVQLRELASVIGRTGPERYMRPSRSRYLRLCSQHLGVGGSNNETKREMQ